MGIIKEGFNPATLEVRFGVELPAVHIKDTPAPTIDESKILKLSDEVLKVDGDKYEPKDLPNLFKDKLNNYVYQIDLANSPDKVSHFLMIKINDLMYLYPGVESL